jgi:hypothetical protein
LFSLAGVLLCNVKQRQSEAFWNVVRLLKSWINIHKQKHEGSCAENAAFNFFFIIIAQRIIKPSSELSFVRGGRLFQKQGKYGDSSTARQWRI